MKLGGYCRRYMVEVLMLNDQQIGNRTEIEEVCGGVEVLRILTATNNDEHRRGVLENAWRTC